jgi:hypothetical protein
MESLQPPEVIEAYAFAKTPSYLYRKLRSSKYVQGLAAKSSEHLMMSLSEKATSTDPGSIALAYANFVALLMRKCDVPKLRQMPGYTHLLWADALIAIHASKPQVPEVQRVRLPKISQVNTFSLRQSLSSSSANATVVRVNSHV